MTFPNSHKALIEDQNRLKEFLNAIPKSPGCYLMYDVKQRLLYVGKSKCLINRVRSYFKKVNEHSPRIKLMVQQVYDIQFIITDNESEALTLEDNLIKSNNPYFNILLKDDKRYPYVCITWSEDYPRIFITRRRLDKANQDRYYGPYVDVNLLRKTLFLLKSVFPLRQRAIPLYKDRTCLNYSIKRCPGVCQENISSEDYKIVLRKVEMVFQGRSSELRKLLLSKMKFYADKQLYEKASIVRDQLRGIDHIGESQKMTLSDNSISRDIVNIATNDNLSSIQLFQMREGRLVGRLGYFSSINTNSLATTLQIIIEQHYSNLDPVEIPKEIVTGAKLPQQELIQKWISEIKGKRVYIKYPIKGILLDSISLVKKNAEYELQKNKSAQEKINAALEDLAELLQLNFLPSRIEGYDISHIQGSNAVGSQVVFVNGHPAKQHYRKYKIRSSEVSIGHSDDYLSLKEVIKRRFRKWAKFKEDGGNLQDMHNRVESILEGKNSNDWPDLLLIDGGKGQLNSVLEALTDLNIHEDLLICSLAKKNEEIYLPNKKLPLIANKDDPSVLLLRRIRNEAHRFAITFHKNQRSKHMTSSQLLNIKGLGPKRKKELINHFKSVDAIELASVEEINQVPGLGLCISKVIWNYFHPDS